MYRYLLLLTLAVYGRTLTHALLWWDDQKNICTNPYFKFPAVSALKALWSDAFFGLYVPATYTAWFGLARFSEFVVSGDCLDWAPLFHGFNLSLHLLNGWLVYNLLRKVLPPQTRHWNFVLATGFFLLHPLQVEPVAWVSSARDLLSTTFGLLALRFYLGENALWSLPFFALSLLAKPVGVVFPFLALLLAAPKWRVLVPAVLMAGALSVYTKHLQNDSLLTFQVEWWERPLIAIHSLGFYIYKWIIPWNLVPDYRRSIVALQEYDSLWLVSIFALIVPVLFYFFKNSRRPILWILISLGPVLGFLSFGFQEISTVADRFFYIPMIGISWLLATVQLPRRAEPWVGTSLAIIAALCFWQISQWKNDESLFRHNVSVNDSTLAHGNLANVYFQRRELQSAEPEYRLALSRNPMLYDAWLGLGRTLELTGRIEEAEAVYRDALKAKAANAAVLNNLATLLYQKANPECEVYWLQASKADPLFMEPLFNLGQLYARVGDKARALEYFRRAQSIAPTDVRIHERIEHVQKGI